MTNEWIESATQAYQDARYDEAAEQFARAAESFEQAGDVLNAAEMRNNQAVALLQAEKAQASFEAAQPTLEIFEQAGDWRRLGLAWGNVAAALEALNRLDEAQDAYRKSSEYLGQAGEAELQAEVLKSLAAVQLRQGKLQNSAFSVLQEMGVDPKLPWWKRALRAILHWMIR